jgi:Ca-activated chloride channel family protein
MIEWMWPWAALAVPLPLLLRRWARPLVRPEPALTVPDVGWFATPAAQGGLVHGGAKLRIALLAAAWLLLVLAVMRPQHTGEPVSLPATGRDLMLAVDISGSMSTEDMVLGDAPATRLAAVKHVVNDFVERRRGDRVGLILFGTNAYLQAPLSFDLHTVSQLLSEAPVGIAGGKTAVGDAVGLALKHLRARPAESRVLILMTDGASNVGEVPPAKAAELAAREGIRIHTVAVGADELRLPSIFGGFLPRIVNPSADLDEPTLKLIAQTTGGQYFRARDTGELAGIYAHLDRLEPAAQEAETYRPIRALYHWPLGAALLAFVLAVAPAMVRRHV